ncbi:hypothetical protein BBP40_008521 [Aspergillus hancockii]|nr:hypothetical protein BBP40_008521 [Aspergillus hancockii]
MGPTETLKPITELALFHIKPTTDISATRSALLSAAKSQAEYSRYPVYLFKQIEDPSYIYLLGGWSSISTHLDHWIPGPTNQALMASLGDKLDVEWMIHIDIDPPSLKTAVSGKLATTAVGDKNEEFPLEAPVLAIGRYFIATGQKDGFLSKFEETKACLTTYIASKTLKDGPRVAPKDKSQDGVEKEEFVLFSGWNKVQDHFQFAESEGFKGFKQITNYVEGAEIRHVTLWKD